MQSTNKKLKNKQYEQEKVDKKTNIIKWLDKYYKSNFVMVDRKMYMSCLC